MLRTVWVLAIIQGNTLVKELAGERFFFFFLTFPFLQWDSIHRGLSTLDKSVTAELQVSSASDPDSGLLWAVN